MLRSESRSRALLERASSSSSGAAANAALVDELTAAARLRELNERRELLCDLELKERTIVALQTELDFTVSRFMSANATLSKLSNERAQIALSNAQAQLELDVLRARLAEEEAAFAQLAASKKTLVDELEALTQSLFEEANALVSTEARERFAADTERARLERALAAKELELRISQELLVNLNHSIEFRGHHAAANASASSSSAARSRAADDADSLPASVSSAPLPELPVGGAVRRRSMGAAVGVAGLVDASTAPLASIHVSVDHFPAAPSFAALFGQHRRADPDNDNDDGAVHCEDSVGPCDGSGAMPARELHRSNALLRRVLLQDVLPCLNPFADEFEMNSVNVSLLRALFPNERAKWLNVVLEAIFARQCSVDRLPGQTTQVQPCSHCRHVRDCGYTLRCQQRAGRPICKPCRIRITAVQQYVAFVERVRCGADARSVSEAYAVFARHRIAMHVARVLCPTESLPSSPSVPQRANVASADWFAGASADDAFFCFAHSD